MRTDTRRRQEEVEAYVRRHRLDAVVETALADPDAFRTAAAAYRAAGHRIEVAVLAVPEAVSQLSVLEGTWARPKPPARDVTYPSPPTTCAAAPCWAPFAS
ncbi:zeta toxin family protein [Streptomyces chrestomyceticus]|uniref:zeta toxin family protein n=1 Tax=Streptomyces chrestomyceticus TaxID=68185 RepID=UPI0034043DD9